MTRSSALPVPENGSNLQPMVGAVIYVRVSDPASGESEPRDTAQSVRGVLPPPRLRILDRFKEQGESAKTADRPSCRSCCSTANSQGQVQFVVVFNLTRFAREKPDHFALRAHLKSLGISLRSATEPIDDTATGKLMAGVLAAFAQFDNDCRSDHACGHAGRAGARALDVPGAYRIPQRTSMVRQEPRRRPERAPFARHAFEQFATGRFTKKEVLAEITRLGLCRARRTEGESSGV